MNPSSSSSSDPNQRHQPSSSSIHDLPDVILSNIIAAVSDTRSRNAASLVCHKWHVLERLTRTNLSLRGNARNLFFHLPNCFKSVTHLDLSLLTPWGHSLCSSPSSAISSASGSASSYSDPHFLSLLLRQSFPMVSSLTVYARTPDTMECLAPHWPDLTHLKLVRWHQRPPIRIGADFVALFDKCKHLVSLDLSNFYYWTEDLPPVMELYPDVAANLVSLNLLAPSFSEGFRAAEIRVITKCCPNLREFKVPCIFDSRFSGFLGDDTLVEIAVSCPKLRSLHLADAASLGTSRGDPDEDVHSSEDAGITGVGLIDFFSRLSLIEELVLDVCRNVRESGVALEALNSKCPKLKSLKLGHFHGVTMAVESQLDGIAICEGLESLSLTNCADLTDMGLIAIARGCSKLAKFEVEGCQLITWKGIKTMACLLRRTLSEVKISCCKNLDAVASLQALEPVCDRIKRLHIDCVWNGEEGFGHEEQFAFDFDLNESGAENEVMDYFGSDNNYESTSKRRKCGTSEDMSCTYLQSNGNGVRRKAWCRLQYLSLWISVGELITPLTHIGLKHCPNLEEIRIKVEGDCRERPKPSERAFGLGTLACYPQLSKMQLDCRDVIGYALTAPSGQMDLSLWERFHLNGIGNLSLNELDYWPPQDRDVNQRSLSLPAVGLLAECNSLRKLFIHGTTHEHFLMFLPRIPNLRDVQLREDYYPAPENDMSTEMRVDSCSRFEDTLNNRSILD
ncbi:hypothetical protein QQ045_020143 [Rhodiola kirilowii]